MLAAGYCQTERACRAVALQFGSGLGSSQDQVQGLSIERPVYKRLSVATFRTRRRSQDPEACRRCSEPF